MHACLVMSNSSRPHRLYPTRLLYPQNFPGKKTAVGCHFLLQGTFLTQDQTLVPCFSSTGRQILYHCASWEVTVAPFLLCLSHVNLLSLRDKTKMLPHEGLSSHCFLWWQCSSSGPRVTFYLHQILTQTSASP